MVYGNHLEQELLEKITVTVDSFSSAAGDLKASAPGTSDDLGCDCILVPAAQDRGTHDLYPRQSRRGARMSSHRRARQTFRSGALPLSA